MLPPSFAIPPPAQPFPPLSSLSPAPSLAPSLTSPDSGGLTEKPAKRGKGRPRKRAIAGRKARFNVLVKAGRLEEACAWHKRAGLARYGIPAPALPAPPPPAAGPASPDSGSASHGGEGVSQRHGRENWDKTTPASQNSQCSPLATATAVPLAVEADLTRLAAKADYTPTVTPPTGESEGDRGFCQPQSISCPNQEGLTDKVVSVWPEGGEGIVGRLCRNKQYNELRVVGEKGELWTKVGNWLWTGGLVRGERVLVNRVWVSGDDTDAEYEVVRRLDVNEGPDGRPIQPQPESGSDSGSESVPQIEDAVVAHESAIREQQTPEASLDAQQTPKAILPQFQREEPDYPRKQESAEDYIFRIRAEAAMWANGQGR